VLDIGEQVVELLEDIETFADNAENNPLLQWRKNVNTYGLAITERDKNRQSPHLATMIAEGGIEGEEYLEEEHIQHDDSVKSASEYEYIEPSEFNYKPSETKIALTELVSAVDRVLNTTPEQSIGMKKVLLNEEELGDKNRVLEIVSFLIDEVYDHSQDSDDSVNKAFEEDFIPKIHEVMSKIETAIKKEHHMKPLQLRQDPSQELWDKVNKTVAAIIQQRTNMARTNTEILKQ
jgi:hypothetical protein